MSNVNYSYPETEDEDFDNFDYTTESFRPRERSDGWKVIFSPFINVGLGIKTTGALSPGVYFFDPSTGRYFDCCVGQCPKRIRYTIEITR